MIFNYADISTLFPQFTEASVEHVCLESDGTEIDDEEYFQTLPRNEVLVLVTVGNSWQGKLGSYSRLAIFWQ